MTLAWSLSIVLLLAGALMATCAVAYRLPELARCRFADDKARKIVGRRLYARVFANMLFSAALVFAFAYAGYSALFRDGEAGLFTTLWQAAAIILLYDCLYYFMHRFAFHQWGWLKRVHAVHHAIRNPNAVDSLYLHPVETFLGLTLLITCTFIVGPVHVSTFALVFAVYSFLNILVHCGLDVPISGLRWIGYLARKHTTHHTSMRGGNFASITPVCDLLFGTAE